MTALWNIDTILLNTILLIVASFLLIIIFILTIVQNFRRKPTIIGRTAIILLIMGLLFSTLLIFRGQELGAADLAQALLMIGLVLVTAFYASSASRQADASVKMAEAMVRPYLLLRLDLANDELLQWDTREGNRPDSEFSVIIRNAGGGPARNLEASLWHPKDIFPTTTKGFLAQNKEWKAVISKLHAGIGGEVYLPELRKYIKCNDPIVITVKYQDIHKRTWVSYLCLERHVDIEAFVMDGEQNIVEIKGND